MYKLFAFVAFAVCVSAVRMELEARHTHVVPEYWQADEDALDGETPIKLTFAVKMRNVDELRREFDERSDPDSPTFRQWFSAKEIADKFGPDKAHLKYLRKFLVSNGFRSLEVMPHGFIRGTTTVALAEKLLSTKLQRYTASHWKPLIRAAPNQGYSLPAHIARLVDFVGGIKGQFPTPYHQGVVRPAGLPRPETETDPVTIWQAYGTKGVVAKNSNSSIAFVELIGQHFLQSDVDQFFRQYVPGHSSPQFKVEGGANNGQPGTESALDSEQIASIGLGVAPQCWSVPADSQQPFLDWAANVNNAAEAPYIFSISYGESEPGNSVSYLHRLDDEFKKMGLRGISVLIAAGDSGVAASPGGCSPRTFDPDWPATSPSITAVGGTELNGNSETLWQPGGGGFSSVFPMPTWQKSAVQKYLSTNNNLPPAHFFNASNRAYPDLSAFGQDFPVIQAGQTVFVGGTSCATPVSAGVFSLLQDALFEKGAKASLGFLNPLIYKVGNDGFHDINSGKCNQGCDGTHGFCTQDGWDPATGYGSPYYPKLLTSVGHQLGIDLE